MALAWLGASHSSLPGDSRTVESFGRVIPCVLSPALQNRGPLKTMNLTFI